MEEELKQLREENKKMKALVEVTMNLDKMNTGIILKQQIRIETLRETIQALNRELERAREAPVVSDVFK